MTTEPTDYSPHIALSLELGGIEEAIEMVRSRRYAFEKLAKPETASETGDLEAACASMARDLAETERRLLALHVQARHEFRRILSGEPLESKPFRREPLRLVKHWSDPENWPALTEKNTQGEGK